MTVSRTASGRDEGFTMVMVALVLVALLTVVAILVDLGSLRASSRTDQSIADLAALSAGKSLENEDYHQACKDIVGYLNANATGMPTINASSFCAPLAASLCAGTGTGTTAGPLTSGRYTVTVLSPVPNETGPYPAMGAGALDGLPCERIRVTVTSEDSPLFAGVIGAGPQRATRSAVVLAAPEKTKKVPALWLLDPTGCVGLNITGGSQVTVGDPSATPPIPGYVALDSDGSKSSGTGNCNGASGVTVDVSGTGSFLKAIPVSGAGKGVVALYALPPGATSCVGSACQQSDVDGSALLPQPTPVSDRATRAPVDWKWNCKTSYPNYMSVVVIPGCAAASATPPTPAYLDGLISSVGSSGAPSSGTWSQWSTVYPCNVAGAVTVPVGNWWVDCTGPSGLSISAGNSVNFLGGNVVFDGNIKMTGGALSFNSNNPVPVLDAACVPPVVTIPCAGSSSAEAAYVYLRDGDITITGGQLSVNKAMVYMRKADGEVSHSGLPPVWRAPTEGPFTGLALWHEGTKATTITGGTGVDLKGTFFVPNNPVTLAGGSVWGQQSAQFIAFQLQVTGGSSITMSPDADVSVPLPARVGLLIR